MKTICPFIMLSVISIVAHSQQTQHAASLSGSAVPEGTQTPASGQPFLHGETANAVSSTQAQKADQPTGLRAHLESLASYLRGRRGLVEIPPSAPPGWWTGTGDSSIRYLDDRGNSLPNEYGSITSGTRGGFKFGWNNALLLRATETDQAPSVPYAGFINMQFDYTAAKGGINNYNQVSGTKTDYTNVLATSEMRTVGQKSGISSILSSFSGGDTLGIQSYVTQFGGFDTSGDEQTEGVRVQMQQGSAGKLGSGGVFEGVVSAIQNDTMTYTPSHDENTIGEHRIIRNLDHVYSTGSIVAVANSGGSPNTVNVIGSGTNWLQLGRAAHTKWNNLDSGGGVTESNLAFCFDPLRNDGYDMCFPVSAVLDDTHLTLNLLSTGPAQNTTWPSVWPASGGYHLYAAAWPTSVDLGAHTFTAGGLTGFARGDKIDQVLAYNTDITGELFALRRHIGFPGQGGGIYIVNNGTANSPRMGFGLGIAGGLESAIAIQHSNLGSGVPNFFTSFYSDPGSRIIFDSASVHATSSEVSMWRLRDSSGAIHLVLSFLRDTSTACVLDTSLCVSAKGVVGAKQLGQIEANDYAGTIAITSGSSAKVSFRQPFKSIPVCTLTPTSDPSEVGTYWVSATPSAITANLRKSGSISFNYICVGNPD